MKKLAIIGAGNIGLALAKGLIKTGKYQASDIVITRRNVAALDELREQGFTATTNNAEAFALANVVVLAVLPQQLNQLLDEVKPFVDADKHLLISVISGVDTRDVQQRLGIPVAVIRAMPNTAIAIGQSMTTIASHTADKEKLLLVKALFDSVGETLVIPEELMTSATALCACGIAFFLRSIRAASQGGVEIGFHAEDALKMATQTALGAAALLLANHSHPEHEIDKVTSPKGCTIAGLNEMEHQGFSSALIKGIKLSAEKAGGLYRD